MEIETTLADLPKHLESLSFPPQTKVYLLVEDALPTRDTLLQLGTSPVDCNTPDGAANHDQYLATSCE